MENQRAVVSAASAVKISVECVVFGCRVVIKPVFFVNLISLVRQDIFLYMESIREAFVRLRAQSAEGCISSSKHGEPECRATLEHLVAYCPDFCLRIPGPGMHPAMVLRHTCRSTVVDVMKGTDCKNEIYLQIKKVLKKGNDRTLLVRKSELSALSGLRKDTLFHTKLPLVRDLFNYHKYLLDNLDRYPVLKARIAYLKRVLCHDR